MSTTIAFPHLSNASLFFDLFGADNGCTLVSLFSGFNCHVLDLCDALNLSPSDKGLILIQSAKEWIHVPGRFTLNIGKQVGVIINNYNQLNLEHKNKVEYLADKYNFNVGTIDTFLSYSIYTCSEVSL